MADDIPRQPWQDRLHETTTRIEEELRLFTNYVNDEVVPDVRRHSSQALRTAASELEKLAKHLDDERHRTSNPPPPQP